MMPEIWVLLMLMWVPSQHSSGGLGAAEFTSRERCEAAASQAARQFNGFTSTLFHVCVPK